MFDALRLESFIDHMHARGERGIDVATLVGARAEYVVVGLPHCDFRGCERHVDVGDGGVYVVVNLDECRRSSSIEACVGDDDGKHVSGVRRAYTDGDHHRPVLVDDADHQFAGNVCGRVHRIDAGCFPCVLDVDALHGGANVLREVQCGVQHAGYTEVVDVSAVAHRECLGLVFRCARSHAGRRWYRRYFVLRHALDGFEDLGVTGASTKMRTQVPRHVFTFERRPFFVDLCFRSHDDAGDAEATLQTAACREGRRKLCSLGGIDALERGNQLASDLLQARLARHDGFAVDEYGATTALSRRRAAVLRGGDVEFFA